MTDFYINDDFAVCHRKNVSVSSLPKLFKKNQKFAGFLLEEELKNLKKFLKNTKKKVLILGGSKISTKLPLIERNLEKFSKIIVGGAIANNFYKDLGYKIGKSLYEKDVLIKKKSFKF